MTTSTRGRQKLPRNHPAIYDQLRQEWWRPRGRFAALHWLARSRARLIPPPTRQGELLVDIGCGGGVMVRYLTGYTHLGIDQSASAIQVARKHGVAAVRGDAIRLPLDDRCISVVVAGELFEHVEDLDGCLDEVARVLRPGGLLIFDTINDTWLARLGLVHIAERLPGGPPPGLHDPSLFVDPDQLQTKLAKRDIEVEWWGLRPSVPGYLRYLLRRAREVELVPGEFEAVLYQGVGHKR